jgi:Tol biopolymer transport system component
MDEINFRIQRVATALVVMICVLHLVAQLSAQGASQGMTVNGHVIREGTQANGDRVQIIGVGGMTKATVIRADNSFEFLNVKPGKYLLIDGQRITMYPIALSVADKDVTQLELRIVPSQTDVWIAEWNPIAGRVTGTPKPLTEKYMGTASGPDWSPGGDQIAVQVGDAGDPNGVNLLIHSFSNQSDQIVRPKLSMFSRPRFNPDGRSVVAQGRKAPTEGVAIYEIDLNSGDAKKLVDGKSVINPSWTRDGNMLFYEENFESVLMWLKKTGEQRLIYSSPTKSGGAETNLNSSPSLDGRNLAVVDGSTLYVIDVASRKQRKILELREPERFQFPGSLTWTPDGRWILFGKLTRDGGELWRVSPDGKNLGAAGFSAPAKSVYFLRVNPDNKRLAFAVGNNRLRLEALDAALKSVSQQ